MQRQSLSSIQATRSGEEGDDTLMPLQAEEPRDDQSDYGYDELEEQQEAMEPKRLSEIGNPGMQAKFNTFQNSILDCLEALAQLKDFRPQLRKVSSWDARS